MIENGLLLIGEPCSPYTVTKYISKQGSIVEESLEVSGRKIPMQELRQRLLNKQEQFMRLQSSEELAKKGIDELATIIRSTNLCTSSSLSSNEMQQIIIS